MFEALFPNVVLDKAWDQTLETLYMTGVSLAFVFVFGLILGLLLFLTSKGSLWDNKWVRWLNWITSSFVNIFRAIPFVLLIVILIPFTTKLMGSMIGASAALPALVIGTAPFYARMVEIGLREIDKGVIEAAKAMGANSFTIIYKVLIPESLPSIVSGLTVTAIALVGSTAIAGIIGAGGLGNYAYTDGFSRGRTDVTIFATLAILVIVFAIQYIGDIITKRIDKR
ncbi:D-methionine transport system permease protein [Gracilibacillus halotolerans]|uniref:D-methionine transport system permease protein n=1 Tax=Gracilibacillus halotolerans TaxID=74386 RepID=A0A841RH36_9BACI|nr:methionine ABC transporter permease [Gracilibacillus halotolerans]MBB6513470.1 D-methionine transport system permease protein [Gracilibacillus halotolerans]